MAYWPMPVAEASEESEVRLGMSSSASGSRVFGVSVGATVREGS